MELTQGELSSKVHSLLRKLYGIKVARIVGDLTNPDFDLLLTDRVSAGDLRSPTEIKYELYHQHVAAIIALDGDVLAAKLSDFS